MKPLKRNGKKISLNKISIAHLDLVKVHKIMHGAINNTPTKTEPVTSCLYTPTCVDCDCSETIHDFIEGN